MPSLDIIDHSPHHPSPAPPVPTASNLIVIDNYDSFTWNVYQYLVLEGARARVFRNDEITLEQLIRLEPTQLVISPGPGHPENDSGISKAAIDHFKGKIPVLGVCMGEQCVFSVFGGIVDQTGEILHGKTSPLRHDAKGIYAGIPQDIPVTRYHSLAGTHPTLPECLEVSSWVATGPDGGKGVIMGVRHREYVIEGVQFHPESILTAEGRTMIKNFLQMRRGTWKENEASAKQRSVQPSTTTNGAPKASGDADKSTSILHKIYEHRKTAVAAQRQVPSHTLDDLQAAYDLGIAPPQIDFVDRMRRSPYPLALMAEIKRASPSKGTISAYVCAPAQAREYAAAGASTISVLTEPEWFKGSLDDLRAVRQALNGLPDRPAVLRKEFVFDEYQILEARLAGADTVLLIVKMLDEQTLTRLYKYSQSLGMEPLVEVNNVEEMVIANRLGALVIGVNNRNLTNFEVDLDTTSQLMKNVPEQTIVCALSGISGPKDVEPYLKNGVGAVLVGEALMRSKNTATFVAELLGGSTCRTSTSSKQRPLVKICGTRTPEAAREAILAGANMIGMIMVTGRKRCVSASAAQAISKVVHDTKRESMPEPTSALSTSFFENASRCLRHPKRALLVGVFQNQPLEYILQQQRELDLDVVQLHGKEPLDWASLIPVPVIRAFHVDDHGLKTRGLHKIPLIDSGVGGTGEKVNLQQLQSLLRSDEDLRVMLAGGLNASNVGEVLESLGDLKSRVLVVDVSSGVEESGEQSIDKIRGFLTAVQGMSLS